MAASLKAIKDAFGKMLAHDATTDTDADARVQRIRDVLVAFEERRQNRDRTLDDLNTLLRGHGVEEIVPDGSVYAIAQYVNMGDTYTTTFLFSYRSARFLITSWGDWYERSPEYRAQQKERG